VACRGSACGDPGSKEEKVFTREDIRDLLDSRHPGEEIADILTKHMHTGGGEHPVVQDTLRRRTIPGPALR
jgi:hypothetical protein